MAMELAECKDAGFASVWQPGSVEEAWRLKRSFGENSSYAAGGTLLRMQRHNGIRPERKHLISLLGIPELHNLRLSDGAVSIGAGAALNECRRHPLLKRHGELLVTAIDQIAEPAFRHLATIGGHVSSLVGDAVPALMAMNAQLVIFRGRGWSRCPILDWIQGKGGAREPGDLLVRVEIPVVSERDTDRAQEEMFAFYEIVGRREVFIPSLETVAAQGKIAEDVRITEPHILAEGGTALPDRQMEAERTINGTTLSDHMLGLIHEAIKGQYMAAENLFAGSAYRKEATANLISAQLWKMIKRK
ncbi:FAD binding domain-containing protein [Paenibacillus sp. NPDC057967]|uniref:FAD binding domain-containing protein n=1 Tax=Paenibacillus sp. NPDC057967 TaxID=3346293 RepID=UPI0036DCB336